MAVARKPEEQHELLDPRELNALGNLELISLRIVEGFVSGKHRSPFKGGCIEFAEHRAYSPGDEVRMIDWRAFARSDRYYIKRYEEETNLQVVLVVDASGSMKFGLTTVSKLRYAQMAAACLGRLLLRQRDAIGLAVVDTKTRVYIPPRSRANHFQPFIQTLAETRAGGETSLADNLHHLAKRVQRRGLIVILSDCFEDTDALQMALHHLASRGHELLLLHVMAPEEITFEFKKWSRFICLENAGHHTDLDPGSVRKQYRERVQTFLADLKRACNETGTDYSLLQTDLPLGETLARYLAWRTERRP